MDFVDGRLFLYRPSDAAHAPWVTLTDGALLLDYPLTSDLADAENKAGVWEDLEEGIWTVLDLVQRGRQRRDQRSFEREIRPIDRVNPRAWRDDAAVLRVAAETGQHCLDRLVLRWPG